ncbi:DUF6881 domain-containing protein [Chitinophaga nivalis]|uniref:DUF6881 domain-containing protein n=1 Tax=Chitinophaga nivalis TaxID=2991709 RepID=A0ABT3IIE4_9BACT|nr:hypothetical protein [Chitinophaga nivalis]MCW3466582.1 hypothetical protein [Chitinophaga nivalis]MCW3483727.1 hypothetical protein [Chitinophaga nivalis]
MEYLKVSWQHQFDDEPVALYSEINACRLENRKIELYPDGSFGLANTSFHFGGTVLCDTVMPMMEDICDDTQLVPEFISREEFELLWNHYYNYLS